MMVWNRDDTYFWDIELQKNGEIVWEDHGHGADEYGEVFFVSFVIDESGELVP